MPDRQQGTGLTDGPPRTLLIAGIAVAAAAVATVLAIAVMHRTPHRPLVIGWVPAPQATSPACAAVTSALPQRLGDYHRATPAPPAPPATAAWSGNGEPIVLRCGLERPADFVVGAPIQVVDTVQWFQQADGAGTTWVTVDRPVYIALTLPDGSGPTPIQDVSDVIAATIPAVPINPGPPRG
ncbi:MAG TPA: DUF3515 domain-containing protein [Mycobacterium sp.]|nr:DUF3515 domain-containing protein [Mycobacterium sp.]